MPFSCFHCAAGDEADQIMITDYDNFYMMNCEKEDSRLLLYALSNIAGEILEPMGKTTICCMGESRLAVLLSAEKKNGSDAVGRIRITNTVLYYAVF